MMRKLENSIETFAVDTNPGSPLTSTELKLGGMGQKISIKLEMSHKVID